MYDYSSWKHWTTLLLLLLEHVEEKGKHNKRKTILSFGERKHDSDFKKFPQLRQNLERGNKSIFNNHWIPHSSLQRVLFANISIMLNCRTTILMNPTLFSLKKKKMSLAWTFQFSKNSCLEYKTFTAFNHYRSIDQRQRSQFAS